MRKLHLVSATALAISMAMPAFAQTAPQADDEGTDQGSGDPAFTTSETGTAQNNGSDSIQFIA